ncbi:MAG: DipZ protein, partial [Solirubrobacterales bacterium]
MDELVARGPVLVHFFDFSQLNSVRTIPYLNGWFERYGPLGLTVLGVQAPRFPFGGDPEEVAAASEQLGIAYPVLVDPEMALWQLYG